MCFSTSSERLATSSTTIESTKPNANKLSKVSDIPSVTNTKKPKAQAKRKLAVLGKEGEGLIASKKRKTKAKVKSRTPESESSGEGESFDLDVSGSSDSENERYGTFKWILSFFNGIPKSH